MENNELYHYGRKGMRWGVRRYQNEDGSLTPAGKARYDRDVRENNAKKKENRITISEDGDPRRWVREDMERSKRTIDATKSGLKEAEKMVDMVPDRKKKPMDLSTMTDKEMRDRINRVRLEREYDEMFNPQRVNRGKETVKTICNVGVGVLGAASTALSIALAIKELSNKG